VNANRHLQRVCFSLLLYSLGGAGLLGSSAAAGRDWVDLFGTPWIDPLLVRPPQLDAGLMLPGDTEAHVCAMDAPDLSQALALQDAVDIALCMHPQLHSTTASIEKSAAQVGEARAAYLPSLQMGRSETTEATHHPQLTGTRRNSERMRDSDFANLTWRLLDFGARDAQRRAANASLDSALASRDAVVQQLLAKVIAAYFEAQVAGAALHARQEYEGLARLTLQISQQRETLGAASHTDTLQALILLLRAELDSHRALRAQQRALSALAMAMGVPNATLPEHGLRIIRKLPQAPMDWDKGLAEWLAATQVQHPTLVAARFQLEQVREQLLATRAEGLPSVDFSYGLYMNGRPNQGLSNQPSEQTVSSVTLKVPLFDGFLRTYKVRGAEAQLALKEAEVVELENRVLSEVREAHADAQSAVHSLLASQKLLDAALEALQLMQNQYDRGVVDLLAVLGVQRSLSEAQQERIRSLSDWHSARLRLLAQVGGSGRVVSLESGLPVGR
jgi:outer membrane protein